MGRPRRGHEGDVHLGRDDYWAALAAGDRAGALDVVKRIRLTGRTPLQVVEELILPAQERLGELWLSGAWSLQQQQAASSINEGLVHWLCSFSPTPEQTGRPVLVASLDPHDLPAVVVCEQLAEAGVATRLLGSVDHERLITEVVGRRPRAVLLSASLTSSLAGLKALLVRLAPARVPVVVGGRAFGGDAARAAAVGATAYAATVTDVLSLLETLPHRLPHQEPQPPTPADVEAAWLAEYAGEITPYVLRGLLARDSRTPRQAWCDGLEDHLRHVLGCLAASLVTGDETVMVEVREWLGQVLASRGAPAGLVAEVWELLAVPLRGHPLARLHLAGSAPVAGVGEGGMADDVTAPA